MKVNILKGKFKASVTGCTVRITCNVCEKSGGSSALHDPVPGSTELALASQAMQGRKPFAKSKEKVDLELTRPLPNAMATMIVAPVVIIGRPVGCQPIVCFHCRQVGLISVEAERPGTGQFGFQPQSLNESPQQHVRRRAIITFIPLLALDFLVGAGHVRPGATVVCAGASLQCQGKRSTGSDGEPRQDAHQILRELSIDGVPLYELVRKVRTLPEKVRNVVTYCHGTISHLDACYNKADCLVESAITVEMIDLGHLVLNGSLRRSCGAHDDIFARLLWGYLMARYRYAVAIALISAEPGALRNVLLFYQGFIDTMMQEGPPDMVSRGLGDLCEYFNEELRPV